MVSTKQEQHVCLWPARTSGAESAAAAVRIPLPLAAEAHRGLANLLFLTSSSAQEDGAGGDKQRGVNVGGAAV